MNSLIDKLNFDKIIILVELMMWTQGIELEILII